MQELFARYGSTGIMLVIWVVVIYGLFASNKKKQKKQNEMLNSLKAGDTVVTIGGIKGVISSVEEAFVVIRIDKGVHMTVRKSAIAGTLN
ncbi:preprotein translocase subunit YajC [Fusobacterium sp.]|uniref:preprotein translocase subunit YajC n=1 Tax=Fusobacterium sp. TaxID=68766 RepID=UPI00260DEAA6|nr:preprotein translocase subunit YajC [Fusobacterium sp.]